MWFIGVEVKQETSAPPPKKKILDLPLALPFAKKNRKNSLRSGSWKVKGIGRKGNREGPWPFPPISFSPPPPPLPFLRLPHRVRKKWIGCLLGHRKKLYNNPRITLLLSNSFKTKLYSFIFTEKKNDVLWDYWLKKKFKSFLCHFEKIG